MVGGGSCGWGCRQHREPPLAAIFTRSPLDALELRRHGRHERVEVFLSAFVDHIFRLDDAVGGDVVAGVTVWLETLLAPHIRTFDLGWVVFVPNDLGNVLLGWSLLVGIDDGVPVWVFV